ncbi:hypothetical protein JCM16358_06950 [Halanaerocella petrolearia]
MLYSIIPEEELLEEEEPKQRKEIEVDGVTMEVDLETPYSGKVVRVISSNPDDYMSYSPGAQVEFGPILK